MSDDELFVYEVALCEHPLVVGEDDDRLADELVADVDERTTVADDLDWPGWTVFIDDPPDEETLRYVNTRSRINVLAPFESDVDVFEEVASRFEVEGWTDSHNVDMSHWTPTPRDEFVGEIHLDLSDDAEVTSVSEDEERLYRAEVSVTYTEEMDIEAKSAEEAADRLAYFVTDDISNGSIGIDAFRIESDATEVE